MPKLPVLKIQRFSTHDGPGIRTTVFLQGCPLRCVWCHNPESQPSKGQFFVQDTLCISCGKCVATCKTQAHAFVNGKHEIDDSKCTLCMDCTYACPTQALERTSERLSIDEILAVAEKDRDFYGKYGGLTLSGGEPLVHGKRAIEILQGAKERKIHTVVETCGYFSTTMLPRLVDCVDLFLFDIKDTLEERHRAYTGVGRKRILENLLRIDNAGGKTVLRCLFLKGVNDENAHLNNLTALFKRLKNCLRIEIFSYHHYGESKYFALRKPYLGKREWIVPLPQLKAIARYFKTQGVPCKIIE